MCSVPPGHVNDTNPSSGFVSKASLSKSFEGVKNAKDKQKRDKKSPATQQKQQRQQQQYQQKQQQDQQQQQQKQQQQQQQQQKQQQEQQPQQKQKQEQPKQQQQQQQQQQQKRKLQQNDVALARFQTHTSAQGIDAGINQFTEYKSIPAPFKQYNDPLILSWNMTPLPQGIFNGLVIALLHRNHSPKFQVRDPSTNTPNAVTLCTDFGNTLLINGDCWIAIYSSDPLKRCYALREAIRSGIHEVVNVFPYMIDSNLEEYFYCKICSLESPEHFCHLNADQETVTCRVSNITACINESHQLPWFGEFCNSIIYIA